MTVTFSRCTKRFGAGSQAVSAVREVDLEIAEGEFFVFLGPSGCGKSTLLNLAAGLEQPTAGRIAFGDRVVADAESGIFVPPRKRNVAMVFQSYALYPHMRVGENIAFPLRVAGQKGPAVQEAVQRAAAMLGIESLLDRKPSQLSGGQRQRVAIARALVRRPALFLLDEPLSNLDAQLRTSTRGELKRLQRKLGVTTLYVTHDQVEAMTLGDRIALLRDGEVVQVGPPQEIYDQPASPFAGAFVGSPPMNLLRARLVEAARGPVVEVGGSRIELPGCRVVGAPEQGPVLLGVRPQHVEMAAVDGEAPLRARVVSIEPTGAEVQCRLDLEGQEVLATAAEAGVDEGETVALRFDPSMLHLFAQ